MDALMALLKALTKRMTLVGALWYVVLFVFGVGTLRPEFLDDFIGVADNFDDYTAVLVGSWLMAVSAVGLVWFLGSVADDLRGSGESRLASIAMAGGVIGAAATVIGSMLFSVGSLRLEEADGALGSAGVSTGYVLALHDSAMILNFAAAPFGFGIAVLATAAAGARTDRDPVWFTAVSALLAIALWIPPISWIAFFFWLAWVLVVAWRLSASAPTD